MRKVMTAKHKQNLTQALTQFNACVQPMQNVFYFLNFFQSLRNLFCIQHVCTRK